MSQIGAQLEDLQRLSGNFAKQMAAVDTMVAEVDRDVQSAWWKGPRADSFREAWNGQYRTMLRNLRDALESAKAEVDQTKQQFEQIG